MALIEQYQGDTDWVIGLPPEDDYVRARLRAWAIALFGNNRYTKFIILARSRVGSSLLVSYLGSHPRIFSAGEIFQVLGDRNPDDIFPKVWGKHLPWIRAAGFKLFYYHPSDSNDDYLWRQIKADASVRIIHLKRRNKLRPVVSKLIAQRDQKWRMVDDNTGNQSEVTKRSVVVPERLLRFEFERITSWEKSGEEYFTGHPLMTLDYESLTDQPETEFRRITEFLGLDYRAPRSEFRKQNPEPLQALISNYDELRAAFAGTEWETHFE